MKYIKAYIKKICPNVEVAESETKSNSRYYTLNNCMTIRLSDHYAVTLKESDLNIVQVFNKDEFIVICKGCGVPMTKKRKEVNDFIKSLYEYKSVKHFVENNKREIIARKKKEEEKSDDDPLKDMYCNAVYKLYTKHRGVFDYGDYCSAFGVLCCDKHFSLITRKLNKSIRKNLRKLYDNGLNDIEFVNFIYAQRNLTTQEIVKNIKDMFKIKKIKED